MSKQDSKQGLSQDRKPASLRLYWQMFSAFFRIGAFTFGGGLAMLPMFEKEVIEKKGWVRREDILDIYAVSQSIPGVIAVNSSIFIGYRVAGIPGATVALAGIMAPSLLIIMAIAGFFVQVRENTYVAAALRGIRASVATLIGLAAWKMGKASIKDSIGAVMAVIAFSLTMFTEINVAYVILAGGFTGWLISHKRFNEEARQKVSAKTEGKAGGAK